WWGEHSCRQDFYKVRRSRIGAAPLVAARQCGCQPSKVRGATKSVMSRVAVAGFTRKGRSRLDSGLSWLAGPSEKHHILRRTSGRFLVLAFFLKVPYEKATFSHDIKGMKKGRFLTELLRFGSSSTM